MLEVLRRSFALPEWLTANMDPFETLIITIISQNTTDRNTKRAFENLSGKFHITPEALANAEVEEIERCLKPAGLYRNKAKVIKEVSRVVLEKYNGSLNSILEKPFEESRRMLMELPGVGPKTADVILLFSGGKPTIPVDTHVKRVSKRLGLAPENGGYEDVRKALQSLFNAGDYLDTHILLISLGRKYCRARNPHCGECPLRILCPSRSC